MTSPTKRSFRIRIRAWRQRDNAEAKMSLVSHLRELRNRLIKAFLFIALGGIATFIWYNNGLLEFIKAPYCDLPSDLRFQVEGQECTLIVTDVLGGFLLRLKVAFIGGIILSSPFWLYQLWAFVTPGLKRNEKRYTIIFVTLSSLLFAGGTVLAYVTLRNGLQLLLGIAGEGVTPLLTAPEYVGFVVLLLTAFGISFQVPLIALMLNFVGVLSYELMAKSRRWAFFLTLVFAAFVTPTQDPFTMLAMAGPMILLFEAAIQVARILDKRRAKRDAKAGFHDIGDDEASPLDASPSRIDDELALQPGDGVTR
ncbi:MAG: twin-arginine translocase subunit TatC [Actinomycetota bacterium]|nr:twin-arginine translocase subunit TatC [Actinomycetota bacterium]